MAASNALRHLFVHTPLFMASQHIACYLAVKDELNTDPLIHAIQHAGKTCYLPVISDEADRSLLFVPYGAGDALIVNRYGIREPLSKKEVKSPHELDMVMLPLLAFDASGHRLGTGGGYYDHTFSFLKNHSDQQTPVLVGLGYANQQADSLPVDDWDVCLHAVLTEKAFISFSLRR